MALDRSNDLSKAGGAETLAGGSERIQSGPPARLSWVTPRLETHESLTVLTQHFFGPAGVMYALQVGCGVSGKKFGC